MLKPIFTLLFLLAGITGWSNIRPYLTEKKLSRENFILILNSYCYENPWGTTLSKQLQEEIEAINPELLTRVTYARLDMQQSFLPSRLQMQSSFTKGRLTPKIVRPRILILVGEESWMLYRIMNLRGLWEQIPVVLCGVHPRILKDYADFFRPQAPADSCYISILTSGKQLQITGVLKPDVSRQNLQLMQQLYPQMQEIAYLSTGSYSDEYELEQLRKAARQSFPQLQISVYNSNTTHPDSICRQVNALAAGRCVTVFNTLPLYLSKLTHPVFSLQDQGAVASRLLGGFYTSTRHYARQTAALVRQIYEGQQTDQLPFVYTDSAYFYLNQTLLEKTGLHRSVAEMPNVRPYNVPPPFLQRNRRPLLLSLIGLLIIGFAYRYSVRTRQYNRSIRASLERYKSLYQEYELIFNHMPVSMLVFDEAGNLLQHSFSPLLQFIFPVLSSADDPSQPVLNLFDYLPGTGWEQKIRRQEDINQPVMLYGPGRKQGEINKYYFRFLVRYLPGDTPDSRQILIVLIDNQEIYEARTIRQRLTQALNFAMNKVSIGMANYNANGQRHYFTSNWLKNLGLEARPANIAAAYWNLKEEDRQGLLNFIEDQRPERPQHYEQELLVTHRDGSQHWLRYQIGVTGTDPDTNEPIFTEISQNIDQAKALEQALYNAMLKAQRSEKLKNAFIANMGHEIRTPLNAIVGFSNLLGETEELESRREMIRQIEENNETLLRLIHDIIDLSKIETGMMDFTVSATSLPDLFSDIAILARMKNKQEKVSIECRFPEIPYCVMTDKVRLKQVLTNFIGNAIKFTTEGSITIGYEVQANELYGYVSDTGVGIPRDQQAQIFDRFYRGTKSYKGFGLGLSISRSIIEGLEGVIGVESEEGRGSTFWFRLPVQQVCVLPDNPTAQPTGHIQPAREKRKILVVEDNESNFLLLRFILQKDYHLIHAWDGAEAVALFHSETPDLILMDIKMPRKNGYEATREIRAYSSSIPIIATTAYALSKDEEKVLYNGFNGYLAKPLQKQALLDTINRWLTRSAC